MYSIYLMIPAFVLGSLAAPLTERDQYTWEAASANDSRSPCPMLNALANHNYLPHNGLNVSMSTISDALLAAVNLSPDATALVGAKTVNIISTTGTNGTFNLVDLNEHDLLEHDSSLSRNDIYFGDNHSFNTSIWATTLESFPNSTISISQAASAHKLRLAAANAANPEFAISASEVQVSFIESALYLGILGNTATGDAPLEYVKVLFEEERIPFDEGFVKTDVEIGSAELFSLAALLTVA